MITLYVLKGKNGKRYIGITNNLNRRLKEHRSKKSKGGQILGEFVLLHTEEYADHKSARKREKFLKSGQGRQWLNNLEQIPEPARGRIMHTSKEACAPPGAFKSSHRLPSLSPRPTFAWRNGESQG